MLQIRVDASSVERMLTGVNVALSVEGLTAFLGGVVDPYLRKRISDRFASEGDDASGEWAQLEPATVAIRQAKGFPGAHPINKRTGQLESFLTQNRGDLDISPAIATLTLPGNEPQGKMLEKLSKAQTGRVGKNAPKSRTATARPVLAMNQSDHLFVLAELEFFIERSAGR